jgi:4,4'-diaponeurosporenoate glycosyltransferase
MLGSAHPLAPPDEPTALGDGPSPRRCSARGCRTGSGEPPVGQGEPRRTLSVVIPARNEAASLPGLLESLASQSHPADEVIVVDDHSSDATAEIASASGARVVTATEVPPGWLGKPWACRAGAERATGDLVAFLDADVTLGPDALGRLLAAHRAGGGLVSVQPHHLTRRVHEQLSAFCNVVTVMGTGGFAGPPHPGMRMAFGPCMLLSRADYDAIGGHSDPTVRGAVCEDAAIAALLDRRGVPVRAYLGGSDVRFRMYPAGVTQLTEGWTKMLAGGARRAPRWASLLSVVWVTGALCGAARGARSLATRRRRAARAVDAGVYAAWAWQVRSATRRVGTWHPATAALFPVPLAAFVGLFARSAVLALTDRPARWRGRLVSAR